MLKLPAALRVTYVVLLRAVRHPLRALVVEAGGVLALCSGRLRGGKPTDTRVVGEGQPRRDGPSMPAGSASTIHMFQWDGFHLNATGCRILSARVKSALVEAEDNASV